MTGRMRLVIVLGAIACGGGSADTAPPVAAPPELVTADTVTLTVPLTLSAQLYVEHDAFVYARSLGVVESVRADIGDRVEAGRVLAVLEDADQVIARDQAHAAFENAERRLQRVRELAGTGAVTRADSEQTAFDARDAALALRQAERDLALTRVRAPFAGIVGQRRVRTGQLVDVLDTLFRVTALRPLKLSVAVPEHGLTLAPGDSAAVFAEADTAVTAMVERVAPTVNPASGTREVILRVPDDPAFRPGMEVRVRLGGVRRPVLAIPRALLREDRYVLLWEDGRQVLRAVTLGPRLPGGRVEVVSGLRPGDRIVRPTS